MAKRQSSGNLYDPRNGGQAIRFSGLRVSGKPFDPARTNYFTIYLIESGSGTFWADAARFEFAPHSLLFFVPYQHIRLVPDSQVRGEVIQFHANFLCVETFHAEFGCSGVLFNDPYSPTFFREFETEIRGGSNLSMFSDHAPILNSVAAADTSFQTKKKSKPTGK